MRLLEYKRGHRGEFDLVGEADTQNMRFNPVYAGTLDYCSEIKGGAAIHFLKKSEVLAFEQGNREFSLTSVLLKENYTKVYALAHCISNHANALFIDEITEILKSYPAEEYVIVTASDFGQFFEYSDYEEGIEYDVLKTENNGTYTKKYTVRDQGMHELLIYVITETIDITDVQSEIAALKISDDVTFVHHDNGVGYASRDLGLLKDISGYIYQNFHIIS
jgi:hypothetical protein